MSLVGISAIADLAKTVVNKFFGDKLSDGEKAQKELELQQLLLEHEESTIQAQKEIIIAELNQQDNFTKRARPMVIYAGLVFISLNHVLFPILSSVFIIFTAKVITLPILNLPSDFWYVWGGVSGLYIWKRTEEKTK